jgi:hypothetical protein
MDIITIHSIYGLSAILPISTPMAGQKNAVKSLLFWMSPLARSATAILFWVPWRFWAVHAIDTNGGKRSFAAVCTNGSYAG